MERKPMNRAERLRRFLRRNGWSSAMDIIHGVGTVKHTNAISELRQTGAMLRVRRHKGVIEYRLVGERS